MNRLKNDQLRELVNHFFLPPRLPQSGDGDHHEDRINLVSVVADTVQAFATGITQDCCAGHKASIAWLQVKRMMDAMSACYLDGPLETSNLSQVLEELSSGDLIALHIAEQNAGVVIRKPSAGQLTIEHFEASFPAATVTQTEGKLAVRLPATARLCWPADNDHTRPLAELLAVLDVTAMKDALPHSHKAGSETVEVRDTADTRYIAELLGGMARAFTDDITETAKSTVYVDKRIDDHVLWHDSLLPWRRSPVWLVIRFAIQSHMRQSKVEGRYGYKAFGAFLLASILGHPGTSTFPSDLLYVMNVKLGRRMWKLRQFVDSLPNSFPFSFIGAQIKSTRKRLDDQWDLVCAEQKVPLPWQAPNALEIQESRHFAMSNSRAHIQAMQQRADELAKRSQIFDCDAFNRNLNQSLPSLPHSYTPPSVFDSAVGVDLAECVLAVERWVAENIARPFTSPVDSWGSSPSDIEALNATALRHIEAALDPERNAEQRSRMLLTVFELWAAVDRRAVQEVPLMANYTPEVPVDILHPLLLRQWSEMERLSRVEAYIKTRERDALKENSSPIWDAVATRRSFAVQYFDGTQDLKALEQRIQADAFEEERATLAEFDRLQLERQRLLDEAARLSCEYHSGVDYRGWAYTRHSFTCRPCALKEQADGLSLQVFERPLPSGVEDRKRVVFELQVPHAFAVWRDLTFTVLCALDADAASRSSSDVKLCLTQYAPLKKYYSKTYNGHNLGLASTYKSFYQTHYKMTSLSVQGGIIKEHPLNFAPFDVKGSRLLTIRPSSDIRTLCHIPLPHSPSPYSALGWATLSPFHTSNQVISRQSDCPLELAIDEWQAFGHMRAGNRIQWRNVLLHLVSGALTWSDPAAHVLVRQLAWQAEAAASDGNVLRQAHGDLADELFSVKLLCALEMRLEIICDNWQEAWTVASLAVVACRIASVGTSAAQRLAMSFLSKVRAVTKSWLRQVVEAHEGKDTRNVAHDHDTSNATASINPSRSEEHIRMQRIAQMAATLRSTFDLPDPILQETFDQPEQLSTFIECGVWIGKYIPSFDGLPGPLRLFLEHDQIIAIAASALVTNRILRNSTIVDDAVEQFWSGYSLLPKRPWRSVNRRWLFTQTGTAPNLRSVHIHINLYDGTLYIDGKTSGNLPADIANHVNFRSLFPDCLTLSAFPSTMEGMDYQLQRDIAGVQVHLSILNGELVVRTREPHDALVREFVPPLRLSHDVPQNLLHDRVHWFIALDDGAWTIEFRPSQAPWMIASDDWRIESSTGGTKLYRAFASAHEVALDPTSIAVQRAASVFRRLEPLSTDLLVSLRPSASDHSSEASKASSCDCQLTVSLPRYCLVFFVNQADQLESQDFSQMILPSDQEIGTLFGLQSGILMEQKGSRVAGVSPRKLVIPHTEPNAFSSHKSSSGHAEITIKLPHQSTSVEYLIYDEDRILGRLIGDGSLESRLYLIYLHALTSSHLPDTLTRATGTELALSMLSQAATFSFMRLDQKHINLLDAMAQLTPRRQYYPPGMTVMQTETWNDHLPPVSQSDKFVAAVCCVLDYDRVLNLFGSKPTRYPDIHEMLIPSLRRRAEFRTHQLLPWEHMLASGTVDSHFHSRGTLQESASRDREYRSYQMTRLCHQIPHTELQTSRDLWRHFYTWTKIRASIDSPIDDMKTLVSRPSGDFFLSMLHHCQMLRRRGIEIQHHPRSFIMLSILAYRLDVGPEVAQSLLGVACGLVPFQSSPPASQAKSYNLSCGHSIEKHEIEDVVRTHLQAFTDISYWSTTERERRAQMYREQSRHQVAELTVEIMEAWPARSADLTCMKLDYPLIDFDSVIQHVNERLFSARYPNYILWKYVRRLQEGLNRIHGQTSIGWRAIVTDDQCCNLDGTRRNMSCHTWAELLNRKEDLKYRHHSNPASSQPFKSTSTEARSDHSAAVKSQLHRLVERLPSNKTAARYGEDVCKSIHCLFLDHQVTRTNSAKAQRGTVGLAADIERSLGPRSPSDHLLHAAGLWLRNNPAAILSRLAFPNRNGLTATWRDVFILYAEALLQKQRELRLQLLGPSHSDYEKEYANIGGVGWLSTDYPDWLLIELESNIAVRSVQADIATRMISPPDGESSVMQLNMGQGKSSVIVPAISASLADGQALVRVHVLKPLAAQMLHVLRQRVSGICNRRVYYLPFSRDVQVDTTCLDQIEELFQQCRELGGVLLCQPEHILSLKLMCMDKLQETASLSSSSVVEPLLRMQRWLEQHSRDIMDESDELLHVRWQLVYTSGNPSALDGGSERWGTIQDFLTVLMEQLKERQYRPAIDVQFSQEPGTCFPSIRIVDAETGEALIARVARRIIEEDLSRSVSVPQSLKARACEFITNAQFSPFDSRLLANDCVSKGNDKVFKTLLVLRGLVVHGILQFCLAQKRWRVDFGLARHRSRMAVPYRAKDVPSPRADFGHPDVRLILTMLSYYYDGLSDAELRTAFRHLLKSDNPTLHYKLWTSGLPPHLHDLESLNLEDTTKTKTSIFPCLRFNKPTIDFYLSNCIFPSEAKEFPFKLTTNAWDLAMKKPHPTTGFSGTNDNKVLLPLSISQLELAAQSHTNAQVLGYILQNENRSVAQVKVGEPSECRGETLLRRVTGLHPRVTVLLDVGAQVLDLKNEQLASHWLKSDPRADAAVFFGSEDQLSVINRSGRVEPFSRSVFKDRMDKCVLYLDHEHTRGTDVKLPDGIGGAVTLGPHLTKDTLVQGCMRLRKLGSTHSLVFLANGEISQALCKLRDEDNQMRAADSSDVLAWVMRETCSQVESNLALWAHQGVNFDGRQNGWEQFSNGKITQEEFATCLREREAFTLEELYDASDPVPDPILASTNDESPRRVAIREKCIKFGTTSTIRASVQEEQERELAHEKEIEREVERAPPAPPLPHNLHPDVVALARTGTLRSTSEAFVSLWDCLEHTDVTRLSLNSDFWTSSSTIVATADFKRTIELPAIEQAAMNSFLRPTCWMLSGRRKDTDAAFIVLISPFEANELLPMVRKSSYVHMHQYSPRILPGAPPLDPSHLDFCVVPSTPFIAPPPAVLQELDLFAGMLFLETYEQYEAIRSMTTNGLGTGTMTTFRELLNLRRHGQGISLTHMGKILMGRQLQKKDFFQMGE